MIKIWQFVIAALFVKVNLQGLALGISQGGMGDITASKKNLQAFVDDNPKHPLVADAKQVIAEL